MVLEIDLTTTSAWSAQPLQPLLQQVPGVHNHYSHYYNNWCLECTTDAMVIVVPLSMLGLFQGGAIGIAADMLRRILCVESLVAAILSPGAHEGTAIRGCGCG